MLLGLRMMHVGALAARLHERAVLHPRFRIFIKERRGIVCDDLLFGPAIPSSDDGSSYLAIPLSREVKLRASGREHELEVGEFVGGLVNRTRSLRQEGSQTTLVIEWRQGLLGTRPVDGAVGRVSKASVERLRVAASGLGASNVSVHEAGEWVAEILRTLRAEGLPFDPIEGGDLMDEVPEPIRQVSEAVDRALSSLQNRPGHIDLQTELGWSRSRLHRTLTEYREYFGLGKSAGWRKTLHQYRLQMGAALMTNRSATTEGVAKVLGYSSPKAFCYAFAMAGLPSPGAVPERLRQIR